MSCCGKGRARKALDVLKVACTESTNPLIGVEHACAESNNPLIDFNRGVALYKLGRTRQAIKAWQAAANGDPVIPEASRIIASVRIATTEIRPWNDYWFGASVGLVQRMVGLILAIMMLVLLLGFLWIAFRREQKMDFATTALLAAFLLALFLIPTAQSVKVGEVEITSLPRGSEKPRDTSFDVKPALTIEDIVAREPDQRASATQLERGTSPQGSQRQQP
jgi:hypothetical protein